ELDRLVAQQDLDGSGRLYAYNVLDEVTGLTHVPSPDEQPPLSDNAPPTRTTAIHHDFERDAIGRLLSKRTEDGTTDYGYDAADNLLSITFTDNKGEQQRLDYTYDANGQLLSETNSAGLLQTAMTSWATSNYGRQLRSRRHSQPFAPRLHDRYSARLAARSS
ncbi:RHS repeat domain-containing protein, partial [Pseudomonas putida]